MNIDDELEEVYQETLQERRELLEKGIQIARTFYGKKDSNMSESDSLMVYDRESKQTYQLYEEDGYAEGINIRATHTKSQGLAEEAAKAKKIKTLEEMVPPAYMEFRTIFEKKASERFPTSRPWDHEIELKENWKPNNAKIYPMSPNEREELDKFITEHLKKGYIRESKSQISSPFFFIKKKDGSLRPVQDYRYLNSITVKNDYPLPLISDLIDKLQGAKIFSKLDLRWGYNNVRIKEGDQWKAAFKTNRGMFEPLVMFFGLTNSPATAKDLPCTCQICLRLH